MTAICASWQRSGTAERALGNRFAVASRRFGRDPWRQWSDDSLLLGKSLYPLLPEDALADPLDPAEPLGPSPRWVVAADVRLTERDDLATRLGLDAAARSDSALVAAAFERWGMAAPDYLYGVFAIIAWDRLERRLLLVRDALGERPLFYHLADRVTAASMPDVLFADPAIARAPDLDQYQQFMRMNGFAPGSCAYVGVKVVRPGGMVVIAHDGCRELTWWKPDVTPLKLSSQSEYEEAVRHALENAVSACLPRISGRIGAHLSAGFDSTAVATTAARLLAGTGERMTAFVAVPRAGPGRTMATHHLADESALAKRTAALHENMDLLRVVPARGPIAGLERARGLYPTPVLNLCNLPWVEDINDRARERGVSVLLTGMMGNTSISESGVWALRELARQRRFRTWWGIARGLVRGGWMRWRGVAFNTFEEYLPERLWKWAVKRTGRELESDRETTLLREAVYASAAQAYADGAAAAGWQVPDMDDLGREHGISSVDYRIAITETNGAGDQFKAILAEWGLDLRDPTADRRLFELALRIPVERLIWNGEPRAILRKILADRAPPEVLNNRKRGYQSADWAKAICEDRSAFVDELERLELYEPTAAFIDTARVRRMIENMPEAGSNDWDSDKAEIDYRVACLRTISAASHLRSVARSNV